MHDHQDIPKTKLHLHQQDTEKSSDLGSQFYDAEAEAESESPDADADADAVAVALPALTLTGTTERRLMAKIDWHLIPILSVLYLLAFLDRYVGFQSNSIQPSKHETMSISIKLKLNQLSHNPAQLTQWYQYHSHDFLFFLK